MARARFQLGTAVEETWRGLGTGPIDLCGGLVGRRCVGR